MIANNKRKCFTSLILFFCLLSCYSSNVSASERIGLVKTSKPGVTVIRETQEIELSSGSEVFEGDMITTDSEGGVGITFNDGAVLTLGTDSKLVIEDFLFKPAENKVSFISKVLLGSVAFMSGAIGRISPKSVAIKTPTATLGLRGTKILIEVD